MKTSLFNTGFQSQTPQSNQLFPNFNQQGSNQQFNSNKFNFTPFAPQSSNTLGSSNSTFGNGMLIDNCYKQ